jgi:hypothetical protein
MEYRVRQLIRVTKMSPDKVWLVVPGWDSQKSVCVPRSLLPSNWKLKLSYRFFATVNLRARVPRELKVRGPFEEGSAEVPEPLPEEM